MTSTQQTSARTSGLIRTPDISNESMAYPGSNRSRFARISWNQMPGGGRPRHRGALTQTGAAQVPVPRKDSAAGSPSRTLFVPSPALSPLSGANLGYIPPGGEGVRGFKASAGTVGFAASEAPVECRSLGNCGIFLVDGCGGEGQGCGWDPVRTGGDGNPA